MFSYLYYKKNDEPLITNHEDWPDVEKAFLPLNLLE